MNSADEVWKVFHTSKTKVYSVSSFGRVKSTDLSGDFIVIKTPINDGYYQFAAWSFKAKKVHKIVAKAFLGKAPKNKEVNHKDGNKLNNAVSNLEYITHGKNVKHAFDIKLRNHNGINNPAAVLTEEAAKEVINLLKTGELYPDEIAKKYSISRSQVYQIKYGCSWPNLERPKLFFQYKHRRRKGEHHHNAVLTSSAVIHARKVYDCALDKTGLIRTLAYQFGVSCSSIGSALRRKTWDHI